jgi:hypothetical protein
VRRSVARRSEQPRGDVGGVVAVVDVLVSPPPLWRLPAKFHGPTVGAEPEPIART